MESKLRLARGRYWKAWRGAAKASMLYAVAASPLIVGACGEPLPGDEISVAKGALNSDLGDFERKSIILFDLPIVENTTRTAEPCLRLPGAASMKWTMGYLLKQAASSGLSSSAADAKASDFVKRWIDTWSTTQTINGETIVPLDTPNSAGQKLKKAWRETKNNADFYAMDQAPFRLLAIVPRFDLRKRRRDSQGLGGELRFVFGAVDNTPGKCSTIPDGAVILEYAVDRATENDVVAWAQAWVKLSTYRVDFDSTDPNQSPDLPTYLSDLAALTESVVRAGKGKGYKLPTGQFRPNGSELIRIRTNEKMECCSKWQFREWVIDPATGLPKPATVKQTPRYTYKTDSIGDHPAPGDLAVGVWADASANTTAILNDTFTVPNQFPNNTTKPMLGYQDSIDESTLPNWQAGFNNDTEDAKKVRHLFALNTCAGCHFNETGTQTKLQVNSREPGVESMLSGFLTGIIATDPINGTQHYFHEAADRAVDLTDLASGYYTVPLPEGITSTALATYFKLVNGNSKCLDMGGSSAGVLAQQWTCGGAANQRFTAISSGGGNYNIRVKQGNYCLQAETNNTVTQRACSTSTSQKAVITSVLGLPYYEIKFINTNKCLELPDSNNGTKVRQSTCGTGAGGLLFSFVE